MNILNKWIHYKNLIPNANWKIYFELCHCSNVYYEYLIIHSTRHLSTNRMQVNKSKSDMIVQSHICYMKNSCGVKNKKCQKYEMQNCSF